MILALDIGGTKIAAGLVSPTGKVKTYATYPTEASKGGPRVLKNIHAAIAAHLSPQVKTIGVGVAGQVDEKRGVFLGGPNLPRSFRNIPLRHILEKKYNLRVTLENDARCFALAEAIYGAGRSFPSVFGVALGTGVGGGLIINKKIDRGATNTVGEVGHLIVTGTQKSLRPVVCSCGKVNHLESFTGGASLTKRYKHLTGRSVDMPTIERLFQKNDSIAKKLIEEARRALAISITNILILVNPDCIIIGGGLAKFTELWQPAVREARKLIPFSVIKTPIFRSKLGAKAALIGAALTTQKKY